jgi:hypothetical protein
MKTETLNAVVVTEHEADLIFVVCLHCRDVLEGEPGYSATRSDLLAIARKVAWRDDH